MEVTKHVSVLWQEVLRGLSPLPGDTVIDATLGGGGHTRLLLEAVGETGRVLALDMDEAALARFKERATKDVFLSQALENGRLMVMHANFADILRVATEVGIREADVIFADLGYSSDQMEDAARGLSFLQDGPLDMRLNQSGGETAAHIVNVWREASLAELFVELGDEECARSIARAIAKRRIGQPFVTTLELAEVIAQAMPMRIRSKRKTHPATKVFQALRIAVNEEFTHLEQFLAQAVELLAPGGRLGVISFHSGEDRRVKHFFRQMTKGCECPPEFPLCVCHQKPRLCGVSGSPVVPSEAEVAQNPRARSAKFRLAKRA